jgi:hypothetical protein
MERRLSAVALMTALVAVSGCFDEPTPAYKAVPPEARVYLKDKSLGDLKGQTAALKADVVDYLNLDRNQLTNVDEVASLSGLKWLRLNDNRLSSLPDLKALSGLRRIYLRNNRFAAVPEQLKDLPALTDIDMSGNPVKEVPAWLAEKKGLKNLSFSRTQVTKLPEKLDAWKSLQSLQLGDLNISAAEMARIRKALPDVAIVF